MAAEGKESKMDDIEETVKEDAMRDRTYSASSVSGLSGDSHRGGDMAIDEMGSIDEILEDERFLVEAEEKVLAEREELENDIDADSKQEKSQRIAEEDAKVEGSLSAMDSQELSVQQELDEEIQEAKNHDVIISSLGSATVNWIKKRRGANSRAKVAMTFHNEKQLRRIFNGFDFTQDGNVDLIEFHRAVQYCKEDRSFKRMFAPPVGDGSLDNLITAFMAMDTDGDGTVDFHEFCIGMTGTAKGPFEEMSDYDINRLVEKFLEFAEIQKRNIAIDYLETPADDNNDYAKIKTFKQLFTTQRSPSKARDHHNDNHDAEEEMMDEEDSEMLRMRAAIEEERSFCRKVTARIGSLKPKYTGIQKYIGRSRVQTDSFLGNYDEKNNQMSLRLRATTEGYSAIRNGINTRMITDTKGSNKSIRGKRDDRSAMSLKSLSISTGADTYVNNVDSKHNNNNKNNRFRSASMGTLNVNRSNHSKHKKGITAASGGRENRK